MLKIHRYLETIALLYTEQSFHFPSGIGLQALQSSLSHQNFHQIRHLKFDFDYARDPIIARSSTRGQFKGSTVWTSLWGTVSEMKGVKVLDVEINANTLDSWGSVFSASKISSVLEKMKLEKRVDVFEVKVRWIEEAESSMKDLRGWLEGEDVPFESTFSIGRIDMLEKGL